MADGILLDNDVILDNDNNPLSGGSVTVYETGTTTLVTLYSDAAGTTPTTNPIEVDGSGRAPKVYVTTTTALESVIRDANGASIRTIKSVPRVGQAANAAANVSLSPVVGLNDPATWVSGDPTTGTAATDVQTGLEAMAGRFTPISNFSEFTLLPATSAAPWRTALGLGTFAVLDEADRTLSQSVWNTGTSTTEGLISPAKLEAKIDNNVDARVLNQSTWNTGTSTTEATITPAKLQAKLANYTSAVETASSGQLAIAADTLVTWAHGLSSDPKFITLELVCTATDGAFSIGNQIIINPASNHTTGTLGDNGVLLKTGSPNVAVYFGANVYVLTDTFSQQAIDFADWELVIHAMTF